MSASSISLLVAAGRFVEGLVELREVRDDLCVVCSAAGCWRPNLICCSELRTGEIQPAPSNSQEVTLRVLSRAADEQRGHVARSTQREMLAPELRRVLRGFSTPPEGDTRASGTSGVAVDSRTAAAFSREPPRHTDATSEPFKKHK